MKTAEEIEKALDELMIARGEHPTRVRNPLYGEERELAIALAKWAVADYKERVKAKLNDESFMGNACLSYQHDFGLLPLITKQAIENDYKEWRIAMLNNGLQDTTNKPG
jgi:hypothetical protein